MLTGIKPTGTFPHIGNLMGAMLPLAEQAKKYDTAIFIPDLHALTSIRDGKVLNENIRNGLIAYLAVLGRDTEVTIFRQSDMVGLTKLSWILSCFTPYSLMARAHSFKDYINRIDKIQKDLHEVTGKLTALDDRNNLNEENDQDIEDALKNKIPKLQESINQEKNDFYDGLNM